MSGRRHYCRRQGQQVHGPRLDDRHDRPLRAATKGDGVTQPPPLIGAVRDLPPAEAFAAAAQLGAFTALANITGQPAISLPLGLTTDGLPMGVQLAGALFAEGELLAVARQLEHAMPWKDRHPPELP